MVDDFGFLVENGGLIAGGKFLPGAEWFDPFQQKLLAGVVALLDPDARG